jgi:hypothetical protein
MAMGGPRGGYAAHGGGFVGVPQRAYPGGSFNSYPGRLPYYPKRYPFFRNRYPWWAFRRFNTFPWWLGWFGGTSFVGWDPSTADPNPGYGNPSLENSGPFIAYQQQQQQEIDRLNDEVARLRAERAPTSPTLESPAKIQPETVLVFRDRHSEEILNYAIAGGTMWVFTEQRARKIPIAELDVPATTKANAARGTDFRLPGQ